jgi:phosphoribosyl 1,2-cyclic phosphodiesterase
MLRLIVLGSGSAGNSALVCTGTSRLLIDAGLSTARLLERLAAVGVEPDTLSGIFITHEHGDHCKGLDVLTRRHSLPILCNLRTREILRDSLKTEKHWHLVPTAGSFEFAGMELETFSVPHDAADPMGLVLRHGDSTLGLLSDVGHANAMMRQKLQGLDTLFIEANYDTNLLAADTKRPWSTKQRIQGRHGHLSNDQTATFISEILTPRLERVILGHLSQDCNTPDLATAAVRSTLTNLNRPDVEVTCACAHEPTPWFPIRQRLPEPPPPPTAAPVAASEFIAATTVTTTMSVTITTTGSLDRIVAATAWQQMELL